MKWKNLLTQEVTEDINKTKPYRAGYTGVCSKCNNAINRGDVISWVRNGKGLKYHQNCSDPRTSPWIEVKEDSPTPRTCKACHIVVSDSVKLDSRGYCPLHGQPQAKQDNTAYLQPPLHSICEVCQERAGEHSAWNGDSNTDGRCPIKEHGTRTNWSINQFNVRRTPKQEAIPEQFEGDRQFDMPCPDSPEFDDSPSTPSEGFIISKQASSGDGLLDLIAGQVQSKVIENIQAKVERAIDKIDASVKEKLDTLSIPSIVVKRCELPDIKIDNIHKQFKDVLQLLSAKKHVYLHGSPGGHKSSIGPQLADALGVRYGYLSLSEQTPEYVVKGFTSPLDGKYYGSQFVDFYENGGLLCWEELDNSNDNLRSSLNTMLENGIASLDKGLVKRHPAFYFLANGNTCGRGAHPAFPSRTAFDAAFAARFFFLEFQYDWKLCQHIAVSINTQAKPIATWAEQVSNWALANGVQLVMSPREVYTLANLLITTDLDDNTLLDGVLRGLDVPSKEKLLSNYPFPHITR